MNDRAPVILLAGVIVAVPTWWFVYTMLGGKISTRYPFMSQTWGSTWRSFVAGVAALFVWVLIIQLSGA